MPLSDKALQIAASQLGDPWRNKPDFPDPISVELAIQVASWFVSIGHEKGHLKVVDQSKALVTLSLGDEEYKGTLTEVLRVSETLVFMVIEPSIDISHRFRVGSMRKGNT